MRNDIHEYLRIKMNSVLYEDEKCNSVICDGLLYCSIAASFKDRIRMFEF